MGEEQGRRGRRRPRRRSQCAQPAEVPAACPGPAVLPALPCSPQPAWTAGPQSLSPPSSDSRSRLPWLLDPAVSLPGLCCLQPLTAESCSPKPLLAESYALRHLLSDRVGLPAVFPCPGSALLSAVLAGLYSAPPLLAQVRPKTPQPSLAGVGPETPQPLFPCPRPFRRSGILPWSPWSPTPCCCSSAECDESSNQTAARGMGKEKALGKEKRDM